MGCSQREWWLAMGSIFALVILCGWNPYVTNMWNHTSPFYPLHTFDETNHPKEDILRNYYTWDAFQNATPVQRFFYSYLIMPHDVSVSLHLATAAIPADIREVSFFSLYKTGIRWGIFPLLLVFSLGLLFFVRKWDAWLVVGTILLTVALQPHSWWDRFVPQIYAFPILVLVVLQSQTREYPSFLRVRWTVMTASLLTVLLVNNSLCFFNSLKTSLDHVVLESQVVRLLRSSPNVYVGHTSGLPYFQKDLIFHFYVRHYLDQTGFADVEIQPVPKTFPMDKVTLCKYFCTIYTLPKKEGSPPQTEDDIFLDYSDVEFAELPEALKTMAKTRWKQIRNAWSGGMISG